MQTARLFINLHPFQLNGAKVNYQQNTWQNDHNTNLYRDASHPIPPVSSGSYIENTNYSPSPYQVPVPSLSSPLPSIKPYSLPKVRLLTSPHSKLANDASAEI